MRVPAAVLCAVLTATLARPATAQLPPLPEALAVMLAPHPFRPAVPGPIPQRPIFQRLIFQRPIFQRPFVLPRGAEARPSDGPCDQAILAAEQRHGIPPGLLAAMGQVESGRADGSGASRPWPWTINVEGAGAFFPSQAHAIAGVRQAQAAGRLSIDVGCLQINLQHHPGAFPTLEEAFDPVANADYAARYLASLRPLAAGDWLGAAGMYHSMAPERAQSYRAQVYRALGYARPPSPMALMASAPALVGAARTLLTAAELRLQARRESDPLSSRQATLIATALDGFVRGEQARLAAVARRRTKLLAPAAPAQVATEAPPGPPPD